MTQWVSTAAARHEGLSLIMEIYVTETNKTPANCPLSLHLCVHTCTHNK